jgi:RluA family pseudouridine synthase
MALVSVVAVTGLMVSETNVGIANVSAVMTPYSTLVLLFPPKNAHHHRSMNKGTFKRPAKRHQPKGLTILYEDRDILVVNKANGLLTVGNEKVRENTAYYLLTDYVRKGNSKSRNRIFVVHRLDRDTSGVLLFAKNEPAKRYLQDTWPQFTKTYCAVVHGSMPEKEGIITSALAENQARKMYSVRDPKKGKLAKTGYRVVRENSKYSMLEINLLTGRKNQIRVHLSEKGFPVVGDRKYGKREEGTNRLWLHASTLTFLHPHTKESMTFTAPLPPYFLSLMKR